MKKFLILLSMLFCFTAYAQTETLNWYMDGNVYTTTQCERGNDILLPTTPTKRGYTFKGWLSYTPIEYLESTGTQWIDTEVVPNNGMILDTKIMPINNQVFVGSLGTDPNTSRNLIVYSIDGYYPQKLSYIQYKYPDIGNTPAIIYLNTIGTRFYCIINGNKIVDTTVGILQNQTVSVKISYSDYSAVGREGRYYYVKIWDSTETLVRDFIPVLDPDGTPCMYDKVEHKFYYNAGTGDFIAGPVVGE